MTDVLAIDVGGTAIKAARLAADDSVLEELIVPTPSVGGVEVIDAIAGVVAKLRTADTAAVGVVVPGLVEDGVARFAANVGWRDVPVRARLAEVTGLPVAVGHDVAAAALAECSHRDGLFVSVGTGIASADVVAGAVSRGATGRAGELGHVPVWPDGELCRCGQRGCLETYASGAAIGRRYEQRTGNPLSAQEIVARLGADSDADTVWTEAVDALAIALAHEVLVRDPARIVLGGGLAAAGAALVTPLQASLTARLTFRPAPELTTARLGSFAGRAGAAALAKQLVATQREGCTA
jgi:glucokinase